MRWPGVEMEEMIPLKVSEIQLKRFLQYPCLGGGRRRAAWFDLFLGCVSMNGISMEIDNHVFPGEIRPGITHNEAMSNMRLIDRPILHRDKRRPKYSLDEYLAIGMNEFINGTHYEVLKRFLDRETSHFDDSEMFKPEIWKGKSLRIPVDFISVYGVSGSDGSARAHIRIGHHIVLWRMPVYPTFKPDKVIFDERVIEEIKKILARKKAQSTLRYCALNKTFNHEDKFTSKTPGCIKGKIPPVRFY